ncbi:hypothetical protein ACO9S2_14010 [Nitrospira sp. NS4]|uniref:hypothetical protein n=1 Tax=Nitrospira sp. NS4 TaxID=3414498 RepID=UPI003C2BBF6A
MDKPWLECASRQHKQRDFSNKPMTELSYKDWQVEVTRVTAFYNPLPTETTQQWNSWWNDLVGVPPENSNFRKRDGVSQHDGPFHGAVLILALQPSRIDWYLKANGEEQNIEGLGESAFLRPEAITKFQELVTKWMQLGSYPSVNRIALGQVLLHPVESKEAGYLYLGNFLHSVRLEPESSDFMYQINRPRQSNVVNGLRINRLLKCAVRLSAQLSFSVPMDTKENSAFARQVKSNHACRVELDINTAQEHTGQFDRAASERILGELINLAKEIAEKGETP